ncbi:hypothetical protein D3C80_1396030 [compost metagenome]
MIDLVHDQMAVALFDRTRQPGQLIPGQDRPCRVSRRRHQRANAVVIPVTLDQVRRQLIAHVGTYRNQLCGALNQSQEMSVARVTGVCQQPVLARIHQQSTGQQQRTRTAGRDEDASRVDVQAIALLIKT